jgi:TRAP-type C4-dicarboxylate transport system permease small subunit
MQTAVPSLEDALRAAMMYGLVPLWAGAGLGDWWCHRRQRMESSAGVGESLLHVLMLGILGPATMAVMLLEVNAPVLLALALACIAHEMVFWWDLTYASRRRVIPPAEQWVHAVQFAAPWVVLVGLALLHLDQVMALVGAQGVTDADWNWHAKKNALPVPYVAVVVVAGFCLVALPFLEELWRCLRTRRATRRSGVQAGLATIK